MRELTVDAVQTTAGAISKHDVGERQGDLVQNISTPVDRYARGKHECVPARRCMTMDDLREGEAGKIRKRGQKTRLSCATRNSHTLKPPTKHVVHAFPRRHILHRFATHKCRSCPQRGPFPRPQCVSICHSTPSHP